jgi:alanyl-tRNA synthetase
MGDAFGELKDRCEFVKTVIKAEEESFNRTLDRGLEMFSGAAEKAKKKGKTEISGEDAFALYDTYGFPLDLTRLMAREGGLGVDESGFEELMEEQRERARAAQKNTEFMAGLSGAELGITDDSGKYVTDNCVSNVMGWVDEEGFHGEGKFTDTDKDAGLVLDTTCFYAESGGQVGDKGMIVTASGKFAVETTEKVADCVVHRGKLIEGEIVIGEQAEAWVDKERKLSRKNHTATHLLQWALQKVLGDSAHQQGSLVCPEYLRFDFTWPRALTDDEIDEVERLVRDKIEADMPVYCTVKDLDEAKKLGAMALFGEKYGSEVRVVAIGSEDEESLSDAMSREFCGGTHVERTGQIEGFKVIKEESVSAGVRRITAMTGKALMEYLLVRSDVVDELVDMLKAQAEDVPGRVGKLMEDNKKLSKQLKSGAGGGGADIISQASSLLDKAEKIGDTYVIVGELQSGVVEQGRRAMDSLRKKAKSAAIVLGLRGAEGKAMLLAAMTDDVVGKGLKAGDVVREIAPIVGGGGGGKPQMAQAGGKNPDNIPQALDKAREIITSKLG